MLEILFWHAVTTEGMLRSLQPAGEASQFLSDLRIQHAWCGL